MVSEDIAARAVALATLALRTERDALRAENQEAWNTCAKLEEEKRVAVNALRADLEACQRERDQYKDEQRSAKERMWETGHENSRLRAELDAARKLLEEWRQAGDDAAMRVVLHARTLALLVDLAQKRGG